MNYYIIFQNSNISLKNEKQKALKRSREYFLSLMSNEYLAMLDKQKIQCIWAQ